MTITKFPSDNIHFLKNSKELHFTNIVYYNSEIFILFQTNEESWIMEAMLELKITCVI